MSTRELTQAPGLALTAIAVFLSSLACVGLEEESLECAPACQEGTVCEAGTCVAVEEDEGEPVAEVCSPACGDGERCLDGVCQADDGCGELTYQGECQGSTLRYCGEQGPVETNCADRVGDDGAPMQCAEVNPEHGYDCVSADFSGGCGAETTAGRCEGDTVIRCESLATGQIARVECPAGQECGIGPDGTAGCRLPGSAGCGAVTYEGYCDGTTAIWCDPDSSELSAYDCADEMKTCAWVSDDLGYWCDEAPSSSGARAVSGVLFYEDRALTTSGLSSTREAPIRYALVQVRRASDDATIASNYTDGEGRYTINYDANEDVYVAVLTMAATERHAVSVRDCPLDDCGGAGNVYGAASGAFTPEPAGDLGKLVIPAGGVAGAFNIFDVFIRGVDFAWENFGARPPALVGQWAPGSDTACGTSCYSSYGGHTIYVLSTPDDTDEYDDPVLGHEFGHFLEAAFSRTDSPGGAHDGSPTDPLLAWGEGYGTYVGSLLFDSPVYIDSYASGASVTDISDTGYTAERGSSRGMYQLLSEYVVSEILWTIGEGGASTPALGHDTVFDVLHNYFPSNQLIDRGVSGVDLVDFLDGWFCRGHQNEDHIRQIVTTELGFPYDYSALGSCR